MDCSGRCDPLTKTERGKSIRNLLSAQKSTVVGDASCTAYDATTTTTKRSRMPWRSFGATLDRRTIGGHGLWDTGGRSMQTRSGRCGSSWRCLRTSLQDSNFVPMRSRPHSLRSKRSFRRRPHRCSIEGRPMRRINLSPRNAEVLGRRRPEEMGWPAPGTARIARFSEDSYTRLRGRAPGDGDSRGGGSGRDRHSRRRRVEAASANRPRRRSGAESPRQRGRRAAGRSGPAGGARRRSRSRRRPAPHRRALRLPPRLGTVVGGDRRLPLRRTGTAEVRPRPRTRKYTRIRQGRPG